MDGLIGRCGCLISDRGVQIVKLRTNVDKLRYWMDGLMAG